MAMFTCRAGGTRATVAGVVLLSPAEPGPCFSPVDGGLAAGVDVTGPPPLIRRVSTLVAPLRRVARHLLDGMLDKQDLTCAAASQWIGGVATRWSSFDWERAGGDERARSVDGDH